MNIMKDRRAFLVGTAAFGAATIGAGAGQLLAEAPANDEESPISAPKI